MMAHGTCLEEMEFLDPFLCFYFLQFKIPLSWFEGENPHFRFSSLLRFLESFDDKVFIPTKDDGPWHMLRRKGVP